MTRRTYVYDPDLDAMIQVRGPGSNHYDSPPGVTIIRDIQPYRTAGSDIAHEGKRVVVGGRRQHREFLQRNGYVEIGNENPRQGEVPQLSRAERINDIRRAMGDFGSNVRDY